MKMRGFTLLELLAVLICTAILAGISTATWWHYAAKIQQNTSLYTIKHALMFTRNLAIAQKKSFLYCGSSDQQHCDGDWSHYHIIKAGRDGPIIKVYNFENKKILIDFYSNFGANQEVEFTPRGMSHGQQGHFSVCLSPSISAAKHCKWLMLHFAGDTVELNPTE